MNQYRRETIEERRKRFLSKVQATTNCWVWIGGMGTGGYGQFSMGGDTEWAHRAAYQLFVGPIPLGLWVLHDCDNRRCVNPEHLYLGTAQDNTRDAMERGRLARGSRNGTHTHPECRARGDRNGVRLHPDRVFPVGQWIKQHLERAARGDDNGARKHPERLARGERQGSAKLTAEQILEIRRLATSGWTQRRLAVRFGVAQRTIGRVVRREQWTHV